MPRHSGFQDSIIYPCFFFSNTPNNWAAVYCEITGEGAYAGSFTSHYIEPLIYPAGLTQLMLLGMGASLLLSLLIYLLLFVNHHSNENTK